MKDGELRQQLLQWFYDNRGTDWVCVGFREGDGATFEDFARACDQLQEHNLIKWRPDRRQLDDKRITIIGGEAKITAHGVDVIEDNHSKTSGMLVDNRMNVHISNSNAVQVGHGNSQQIDSITISQLTRLIDEAHAEEKDKVEAKSLLTRALEHPLVAALLVGAIKVAAT